MFPRKLERSQEQGGITSGFSPLVGSRRNVFLSDTASLRRTLGLKSPSDGAQSSFEESGRTELECTNHRKGC